MSIDNFISNPPRIETTRLLLRTPTLEDASDVFAYASDPEFFRFIPAEPHASIENSHEFLQGVLDAMSKGERMAWGIVDKTTNKFVGSCNFHDIALRHKRAAIGYAIARTHWGRGYMTEAIRAVLAWAFAEDGLHRIEAICDVDNTASERVMQKCGMTLDGTLRNYRLERGKWRSFRLYSILKLEPPIPKGAGGSCNATFEEDKHGSQIQNPKSKIQNFVAPQQQKHRAVSAQQWHSRVCLRELRQPSCHHQWLSHGGGVGRE